jgi:predicted SnoaL-like aldol condensation-catalyzing enzyme
MNNPRKNKEIVEAFCTAVFINHDLSTLDQLMRADYIQHNPDVPQGKAGFTQFFVQTFKAIPDFKYSLKQIVADGDLVWVYSTTTGTHTGGEWLGVQPTGNRLSFDVVDMFRLQDGKIAEHWDVADTYSLFSQLGRIKD